MGTTSAYQQTLDYLFEKLPMFSRIGKAALKPDLTNTIRLCAALGNPETQFKSVHIAGTNGKGSTSHALAAVMQQAGCKTGLYTSPHLVDFRERIRINGIPVGKEWVVDFVARHKPLIEEIQPSFFEITVAMAFAAFAEEKVDIAIIETGLGGRLDSTNVITPLLSIITNISYDHTSLLGNTLPLIAAEKAGIMKPNVPVVIGEQQDETERVFFEHSVHKHSPLYYAQSLWGMVRVKQDAKFQYFKAVNNAKLEMYDFKTDLLGHYQQHNIKTVLTAAELLSHQGYNLSTATVIAALEHVKATTGLHGRWEWLQENPAVICDVAHNPAGLKEVLQQFETLFPNGKSQTPNNNPNSKSQITNNKFQIPNPKSQIPNSNPDNNPNPKSLIPNSNPDNNPNNNPKSPIPNSINKHIVLGFVKDKDVEEALLLFPKDALYYFCNAQIERALPAAALKEIAEKTGLGGSAYATVADAINAAKENMAGTGALLITGSFFIVGEALLVCKFENVGM